MEWKMTRAAVLWLLALIAVGGIAIGLTLLEDEVCVSGQIADAYSTTTYPTVCQ